MISATRFVLATIVVVCSSTLARAESPSWWPTWLSPREPATVDLYEVATTKKDKSIPIVSSVSASGKKLVSGTKSMFTPKKPAPVKRAGTTVVRSSKQKQPEQGFFARMFKPEPPPPPKTVKEWMSLKQVHP